MASYADTTFENEVRKVLNGLIERSTKSMVDGVPVESYREEVGHLRGLREALDRDGRGRGVRLRCGDCGGEGAGERALA